MASKISNPPAGFDELTVEEKLDHVESLWDRIASRPEAVAVPVWHLAEIEKRLKEPGSNAAQGRSWDDFNKELRAKLRQRQSAR